MKGEEEGVSGLLLVDKAAGVTSHDVVDIARRAYGERSIGHLGTLDPFATGLLILLLGRATRLATFIENEPKVYEARVRFGAETDSGDLTGEVVRSAPPPSQECVPHAIASLTGRILQTPPEFSAKKVSGVPAYRAARAGAPVVLAPAEVVVHEWRVTSFADDELRAVITCGGGTYIRALARDLGRACGSAAHLTALRRTGSGPFDVAEASTLDQLRQSPPPVVRTVRVTAQ
ncbi:MAG: tRNA pseudouridine(55) synthase TruB [Gemmatimonadota bacterium]|nr:tRNA pseudouridine(55) synthase TruB [Gemmatimonadota bacterium]